MQRRHPDILIEADDLASRRSEDRADAIASAELAQTRRSGRVVKNAPKGRLFAKMEGGIGQKFTRQP